MLTRLARACAQSHYEVLNLGRAATPAQIKESFLAAVKECHPDIDSSEQARLRYEEVSRAFEVLSHPRAKLDYDTGLVIRPTTALTAAQLEFIQRIKERYLEREEFIRQKNVQLDANLHFSEKLYLEHHKEYLARLEDYRVYQGMDQPYFEKHDQPPKYYDWSQHWLLLAFLCSCPLLYQAGKVTFR